MPPGTWNEWENYVLKELKTLNDQYKSLNTKLDGISQQVWLLKGKAGIWGLIGGAIPIVITLGILLLRNHL